MLKIFNTLATVAAAAGAATPAEQAGAPAGATHQTRRRDQTFSDMPIRGGHGGETSRMPGGTPPRSPRHPAVTPRLQRQDAMKKNITVAAAERGEAGGSSGASMERAPAAAAKSAILRWPDGRTSQGTVTKLADKSHVFTLEQNDPVIREGKAAGASELVRTLKVSKGKSSALPSLFSGKSKEFKAQLPTLADMGLMKSGKLHVMAPSLERGDGRIEVTAPERIESARLRKIAARAGYQKGERLDAGGGLSMRDVATVQKIFSAALYAVAAQAQNPQAVQRAADAMAAPVYVRMEMAGTSRVPFAFAGASSVGARELAGRVANLQPGEHVFLPVTEATRVGGHQLGVSISKKTDGQQYRVSITNTLNDVPGRFVDVSSLGRLQAALPSLLSGGFTHSPHAGRVNYSIGDLSKSLGRWAEGIEPDKQLGGAYFNDTELRQPIQNGGSCVVENSFAFIATVLPPRDYKLAKAAVLGAMDQILKQAGKGNSDEVTMPDRIKSRITSALRGSVTAPPVEAG